jgi:hypothetical protein
VRKTNSDKPKDLDTATRFSATTKKKLKKTFKMLLEEEGFKRDKQGNGLVQKFTPNCMKI